MSKPVRPKKHRTTVGSARSRVHRNQEKRYCRSQRASQAWLFSRRVNLGDIR
jgi:hypothetical protein